MSWKYTSYTPRDQIKLSSDKWASGDPRFYRNPLELVEHSPVWAKTKFVENPASVQRLKECYVTPEEARREIKSYKKAETKDLTRPARQYGRTLTSLNLGEESLRKRIEKTPEPVVSPLENRKVFYMPSATTKLLTRKYSSDLSPTILTKSNEEDTITVVTRGTSPTPTASSVYLRSKRTDYGLEKKVLKPLKKPEMAHKDTQTEREIPLTRYTERSSWSSYGTRASCNSKFPNRLGLTECKRSVSRENSDNSTTSESPLKGKPPASVKSPPTSPVKDSERKILNTKSQPANIRSSLKLDLAKTDLAKYPNSPTHFPSHAEALTGNRSPKVTIEDVSSMSESSEEETTSEEEIEPAPVAMTVKKSVTNFLQNIPNFPQNQSRANLYSKINSLSPMKVDFKKIESGERAWWLESTEKVPDGIVRMKSTRSVPLQDHESLNSFLSPPTLPNRQFSRDNWLKGSAENLSEKHSPREGVLPPQTLTNGDIKTQMVGNSAPDAGEENYNITVPLRKRDYSKSPENFLSEELSQQMKFNQQADFGHKLQNGLASPLEEKNGLEPIDMSGMISKAKVGLTKSRTRLDIKKSSSREMSPKITDTKSEIELYWKELADSINRPLKLCDLDFTDLKSDDEEDILGNNKMNGEVPPPPPMLILPVPGKTLSLPTPPANVNPITMRTRTPAPPPVPQIVKNKKTVKLFWKEVKDEVMMQQKIPDNVALIWDELVKVKVDTQKLEYLFESRAKDLISKKQQEQNKNKEIIVLDPKRSNAINIGMTKLPPPRAIKTAILKMDATVVNKEGIEKLLTMLPTEEEKIRIQEAQNANPDTPLGSAEQFLLTLSSISELEARLRLWAFKLNFENNEKEICEPLMDLKHGMEILRANKTFRGILSTLLSIGNFLNGYDVKGFQIDYLSKVPEVKDTVHKHSLLHHLCIIVMEKFPDSTDLYSEIGAVTRASKVDFDELAMNIKKVEEECKLSWNYLKMIAKHEGHTAMKVKMSDFLADCAERIIVVAKVHKRITCRFQKFAFWLGVPMNRISTTRPNEIFKIISEFALEYRTTRDRVLQQIKKMNREKTRTRGYLSGDPNDTIMRKMNSKEAKDDARLKQLLQDDTSYCENLTNATWRRQRKDTRNLLQEVNNNDEEILDALIKTANQAPSYKLRERRRSRIYGKYCEFILAILSVSKICII